MKKVKKGVKSSLDSSGRISVKSRPDPFLTSFLVAVRKRNTLVLIHRKQLMDQWREKLSVFLGITTKEIGQISGSKKQIFISFFNEILWTPAPIKAQNHFGMMLPNLVGPGP